MYTSDPSPRAPRQPRHPRRVGLLAAAVLVVPALAAACVPASGEAPGGTTFTEAEAAARYGNRRTATTTTAPAVPAPSQAAPAPTTTAVPTTTAPPTTAPPTPTTAAPTTTVPPTTAPPAGSYVTPGSRLPLAGCALFPRDNVFRATVTSLGVRGDSASMISALGGANVPLRAGFSAGIWQGSRGGYPINVVDSRTAAPLSYSIRQHHSASEPTGHWLPANPRFEGWPGMAWDRHLLVVDSHTCRSSEGFNVSPPWDNPFGIWFADSAMRLDLDTNVPRAAGTAVAAGFSMLHGLVRYDEVVSGDVGHVMEITLPEIRADVVRWPAQRSDGRSANTALPPMGSWFRLRADADLSQLGPHAKVIARGLQRYGAILKDTGGAFHLSGEPDVRWNDADLNTLTRLDAADFEVIDPSPMMVAPNSLQIR